jgi:hypothetical protein
MAQPFNYTIQAPSAFESLVSGLRLGTSLEEMRLQQEQRAAQVAQAQQKAMQEQQQQIRLQEIYGKLNAGTATIADRIELGDISGSEATRKGIWETIGRMDENALNARIGTTQQFAFALNKNPELAKSMMDDYLRANPADQTMKRIRQMADMDPKFASEALMMALPGMGQPGLNAYKETVDRLFPEAKKPEATPEILRAIDLLGLPRNLDSIRKYSEAIQRPETMPALQKAQAYRQTLQQRGMQNTPEYAENEQYISNLLVDPTAQTQAQIEANRIAQARLDQSERLNDPLYVENLAAARARGTATGEAAAAKEAQRSAAIATLASIGYNPETGEDDISRLIARSTSGGLQAGAAGIARFWGATTEGMTAINELQAAANSITTDILGGRLGAGISNTDREFILAALGDVGNEQKTAGERYAGWTRAKNRMVRVGMLPKPQPRGAAQQQTQTPQPAPAGGAPRQPTVSNW